MTGSRLQSKWFNSQRIIRGPWDNWRSSPVLEKQNKTVYDGAARGTIVFPCTLVRKLCYPSMLESFFVHSKNERIFAIIYTFQKNQHIVPVFHFLSQDKVPATPFCPFPPLYCEVLVPPSSGFIVSGLFLAPLILKWQGLHGASSLLFIPWLGSLAAHAR